MQEGRPLELYLSNKAYRDASGRVNEAIGIPRAGRKRLPRTTAATYFLRKWDWPIKSQTYEPTREPDRNEWSIADVWTGQGVYQIGDV